MKVGVFQDVHANLPAFQKAIEIFREHGCDRIYHVGDLIAIGPYPREVMDSALEVENLKFIMGNHDYWYAFGIPNPIPSWMSKGEVEHQDWTHLQLGSGRKSLVREWKFREDLSTRSGVKITFMHYAFDNESQWFKGHIMRPTREEADQLFDNVEADYIFYGHNHLASDIKGRSHYINLGSAGCYNKAEVRLAIICSSEKGVSVEKIKAAYEDNGLIEAFERRKVPARDFITQNFMTRK